MWIAFTEENQMDLFCFKKALITYRKSTQLPKNITPHTAESTNIKKKKMSLTSIRKAVALT